MRLIKARVQKYRSVRDSGFFSLEGQKTILVGPNEAGKTALLEALQKLNPPPGVKKLDPLRDYPRSEYNDITTKKVLPSNVTVIEGHFFLEDVDQKLLEPEFRACTYVRGRKLDNSAWHRLDGLPPLGNFGAIRKDLQRLATHVDMQSLTAQPPLPSTPSADLAELTAAWLDSHAVDIARAQVLRDWLAKVLPYIDEGNKAEDERYDRLTAICDLPVRQHAALQIVEKRLPVFVLFSNYFSVRPLIHLEHLAQRIESNLLDDDQYDYGNQCLLKLLGFTARELSNLGKATEPAAQDAAALQLYRDQIDRRMYQLNAASVRLTNEICAVWQPDSKRGEADRLRVVADGQYLKVVVEDSLGVEIELNQRSQGFQWLVSFFVVFFAEAIDKHANAILLLDEPGLNLHALKQREFRFTISRLAEKNQTIYTTHSPFLVGPDELDLVRVVEMVDRIKGTTVHTDVTSEDPGALLPLQEALGYDLAQSLFAHQRNLVLEGLTDLWYLEAVAALLRAGGGVDLNEKIALLPAQSAGKVVYFATILHANKLKVAALLDSDAAGNQAAKQDVLVHRLGNKNILRTKDVYTGPVKDPEIEDLLRDTLVALAKADCGWDVAAVSESQPQRPIVDIFTATTPDFSKYKLAKAFVRWTRDHVLADLAPAETAQMSELISLINKALK